MPTNASNTTGSTHRSDFERTLEERQLTALDRIERVLSERVLTGVVAGTVSVSVERK